MADLSKIPTTYLEKITDMLTGDATAAGTMYVGMGNDGTEAAASDTDLIDPSDEARSSCVESQPTSLVAQWVGSITVTENQSLKEYGLFETAGTGTPPTGGQMLARANVLAGQAVLINDVVEITATITVSQ